MITLCEKFLRGSHSFNVAWKVLCDTCKTTSPPQHPILFHAPDYQKNLIRRAILHQTSAIAISLTDGLSDPICTKRPITSMQMLSVKGPQGLFHNLPPDPPSNHNTLKVAAAVEAPRQSGWDYLARLSITDGWWVMRALLLSLKAKAHVHILCDCECIKGPFTLDVSVKDGISLLILL